MNNDFLVYTLAMSNVWKTLMLLVQTTKLVAEIATLWEVKLSLSTSAISK